MFGWRRQTQALLGRQSVSRCCRALSPTPRHRGCESRRSTNIPLRCVRPFRTSPSPRRRPRRDPRAKARRSHAHRRPSLRESPDPSGKAAAGTAAPLGAGAAHLPPLWSRRPRSQGGHGAEQCGASPGAAAEGCAGSAEQHLLPAGRQSRRGEGGSGGAPRPAAPSFPPHSLPPSLPPAVPGRPAAAPAGVPVPAGSHRGRPAPPARRSRCPLRSSGRCPSGPPAATRGGGAHRPPPPSAAPSSPPSVSPFSRSPSLSLPPAPGAAGKMLTHARPRPLPPRPDRPRPRPRPLPALRVRPQLRSHLRFDSGLGSPGGELQPRSWPQRRFFSFVSFFFFFLLWLLPDLSSSAGSLGPQT